MRRGTLLVDAGHRIDPREPERIMASSVRFVGEHRANNADRGAGTTATSGPALHAKATASAANG